VPNRTIVEPWRTARSQSPDIPMDSVVPPTRANAACAVANAASTSPSSGPIAMTPSTDRPSSRKRAASVGASAGAVPNRSVGETFTCTRTRRRRPASRAAFASAKPASSRSTLCTTSNRFAIAFALFVCTWPTKCFVHRGSPSYLARASCR